MKMTSLEASNCKYFHYWTVQFSSFNERDQSNHKESSNKSANIISIWLFKGRMLRQDNRCPYVLIHSMTHGNPRSLTFQRLYKLVDPEYLNVYSSNSISFFFCSFPCIVSERLNNHISKEKSENPHKIKINRKMASNHQLQ